jgi:AraC family transcriptional regulator
MGGMQYRVTQTTDSFAHPPAIASRSSRRGGASKPPEHLIARSWHQDPEQSAGGRESGVSAAIWSQGGDKPIEYRRPALEQFHVLTVRLQSFQAKRWHDGCPVPEQDTGEGTSCLTFAGVQPSSIIYGAWRVLQVYLPTTLLADTAQQADLQPLGADRIANALTYDPVLHAIGRDIASEIIEGRPGSQLQLDAFGTMIAVHLLRRATPHHASESSARGGLARWQVKRAMACIRNRLEENVTLASLAQEVGLSQYHFARAFKQSTGSSPHHYLLHCRLERAKELLAHTDVSVAEIAARVGYSEATQLSRLFQTALATSPTAYRRTVSSKPSAVEFSRGR